MFRESRRRRQDREGQRKTHQQPPHPDVFSSGRTVGDPSPKETSGGFRTHQEAPLSRYWIGGVGGVSSSGTENDVGVVGPGVGIRVSTPRRETYRVLRESSFLLVPTPSTLCVCPDPGRTPGVPQTCLGPCYHTRRLGLRCRRGMTDELRSEPGV